MPNLKILLITFLFLFSTFTWAIRPFVTDDGRIIDKGQITSEIWLELEKSTEHSLLSEHALISSSFTDWLETTVIGNLYTDSKGKADFGNTIFQAKTLFKKANPNGTPGSALSFGHTFKHGSGKEHIDASSTYFLGIFTSRFFSDHLLVHLNGGLTSTHDERVRNKVGPFGGVAIDKSLWSYDWRFALEIYSGDPYDPYRSPIAVQAGFRYLFDDYFNLDAIVGGQRRYDEYFNPTGENERWVQIGIRLTGDFFTEGGGPGDPHGAKGLLN